MDRFDISSPTPLSDAVSVNVKRVQKDEYNLVLPLSLCFGPRIFGGLIMSMVQQAVKEYFLENHRNYDQPHILNMQWQFFRQVFPSTAKLVFKDVHLGKSGSLLLATICQGGHDCMMSFVNVTNMHRSKGITFQTSWKLDPPIIEASINALSNDSDPRWISLQTPYHPDSFRRVHSYIKFFVPYELQEPSIRDHWLTPSNPETMFTNETIGFLMDLSLPILDNFYPDIAIGGQAATIAAGLKQKSDRETATTRTIDASAGAYEAPALYLSLTINIEIKKLLPATGVKWLFLRSQAKQIKDGKMSMEVMLFDQDMDLVALSQQLCPYMALSRVKDRKQNL